MTLISCRLVNINLPPPSQVCWPGVNLKLCLGAVAELLRPVHSSGAAVLVITIRDRFTSTCIIVCPHSPLPCMQYVLPAQPRYADLRTTVPNFGQSLNLTKPITSPITSLTWLNMITMELSKL